MGVTCMKKQIIGLVYGKNFNCSVKEFWSQVSEFTLYFLQCVKVMSEA